MKMQVISVNVGKPRDVTWKGKTVKTGIFKQPVHERIRLRTLNLDGDSQADLTVHGGVDKAVYAYPIEHYDYWHSQLPERELTWGIFGENLTTQGLLEDEVCIGDRYRIGTAEIVVTQPRRPCYKLGIRFDKEEIVTQFQESRRTGIYFSVSQTGELATGDSIELVSQDANRITVADINRLMYDEVQDLELLERVVKLNSLASKLRQYFETKRNKLMNK